MQTMEREEYLDQYFHRSSEAKKKANERLQLAKEMDAASPVGFSTVSVAAFWRKALPRKVVTPKSRRR